MTHNRQWHEQPLPGSGTEPARCQRLAAEKSASEAFRQIINAEESRPGTTGLYPLRIDKREFEFSGNGEFA